MSGTMTNSSMVTSESCNLKFLDFAYCLGRTEVPLLAHNFSKRVPAIRRPSQDELLGALSFGFFED